ncbi:MAG TPA: TonB family protein [Pyrinomonadaceae bacterium]|nr:TonB family protein [Pyrinomonadaceae bacterium]
MQPSKSQFPTRWTARFSRRKPRCCLVLTFLILSAAAFSAQEKGGRGGGIPSGSTTPPNSKPDAGRITGARGNTGRPVRRPSGLANLKITLPIGCQIWLDRQEIFFREHRTSLMLKGIKIGIEYSEAEGTFTLKGLKADSYTITATAPDHHDYKETIVVGQGQETAVTVTLVPQPGRLTVSTSVSSTLIEVINLDSNIKSGPYASPLNDAEFTPGRYRINVSKEGYRTASRDLTIKPSESIYLEPQLQALPTSTPTPTQAPAPIRRSTVAATPLSANVQSMDKDLIVRIVGASGDTFRVTGTVNVTVTGRTFVDVSGMLSGLPCRVQFVQLENVSQGSLVETPGPSNLWTLLAIRVRPKDSKRAIRFAINWQSLASSSPGSSAASDTVVPAEAIQKVVPIFPAEARRIGAFGTVGVFCRVDSSGNVSAAKAIDGPNVLRNSAEEAARKWRFRPETRNGNPVDSTVTIQFVFGKQ